MTKYIFVTGGVVSSLGKGITAASLGVLLKRRGYRVSIIKMDPYINVDAGAMSPFQHGEVFVTWDGAETDLDLGHYERFIDEAITGEKQLHHRQSLFRCNSEGEKRRIQRRNGTGHPSHNERDTGQDTKGRRRQRCCNS